MDGITGLFRHVLDRSGQAIFVSLAENAKAVDVNQTALDWLGYSRETFLEIGVTGIETKYPIQSPAQWSAHIDEMRKIGRPVHFENAEFTRKDGSRFPVEVTVSLHTFNGVEYVVGVARDVTEKQKAEEELRLIRLSVETASTAMFHVGPDARILSCNRIACERLGYSEAELLEMRIFDLDPDYGPAVWPEHWEAIRELKHLTIETNHRKKSGVVFPVEVSITYVPESILHGDHCCSFIRDISDRKELEKNLRLADRMTTIGTLAAGVAHEINNPLQYVMLTLEHLQTVALETAPRDALDDALEGCTRIKDIVSELHSISRSDEGTVGAVSVHGALDFALKIARTHFRHRARLAQERFDGPLYATANLGQLGQVFLNLVVNAAQAFASDSPDNQIVVRSRVEDANGKARAVVEIVDNGSGIPEEIQGRVFDAFFTTKPQGVGTGLGLSISQSIISSFGGTLAIDSTEKQGTCVSVSIPLAEAPKDERKPLAGSATLPSVLIVDDDSAVIRGFARCLADHSVETATDGFKALAKLKANDFDVVLCDVMMPGLSGPEFYKLALEENSKWTERFVFVTGGACTDDAARFIEETDRPCLDKPISADKLRAALAAFKRH